jgi:hypothetical protein
VADKTRDRAQSTPWSSCAPERARLEGERARVEASTGPVRYLATMAGMDTEQAVRWLILLMVLCCDPAIALTVAATRR